MKSTTYPNAALLEKVHSGLRRGAPVEVRSRQGHLGFLEAVSFEQRLLLLRSPQVRGGALLIPFEAVEHVDSGRREILLRPAREALARAERPREALDDA